MSTQTSHEQEILARQIVLRSQLFKVFSAVHDIKRYATPVLDQLAECEASLRLRDTYIVGSRRKESMMWRLTEMKKFIETAIKELNNA